MLAMLCTSLQALAHPRPPAYITWSAKASSMGRSRSKTALSPPTITVTSLYTASGGLARTGASTTCTPRCRKAGSRLRISSGLQVDMSM